MTAIIQFFLIATVCSGFSSCGPRQAPAYYLSHHPADTRSRPLRHYPVARQGTLTAWLTSDHVKPAGHWMYVPGDPNPKYRIVGTIPSGAMPEQAKHDGSFLLVSGYDGPLFPLWQGTEAKGHVFTNSGDWIPIRLHQGNAVNTWIQIARRRPVGGWSGFPLVIGDPNAPEAIAGAMWYKSNIHPDQGGATSTRMLARWLGRLKFADFVTQE